MDSTQRPTKRLKESLLIVAAGLLLFGLLLGLARPLTHEALVHDAAARLLIDGTAEGRQALVGSFWWAPLPTLLRVPLVYVTAFLPEGAPSLLFAALCAVTVLWLFYRLCRIRLPRGPSLYFVLALLVTPGFIEALRHGASLYWKLLLTVMLLAGYYGWRRQYSLRALVTIGTAGGLAVVSGVEIMIWSIFMFGLLAVHEITRPAPLGEKRAAFLLATLPAIYALGLWILMNWLIMGSPWHFLRTGPLQVSDGVRGLPESMLPGIALWLSVLLVVAVVALLKRRDSALTMVAASMAWVIPMRWFGNAGLAGLEIASWLGLVITAMVTVAMVTAEPVGQRVKLRWTVCLSVLGLTLALRWWCPSPVAAGLMDGYRPERRHKLISSVSLHVMRARDPYVKVLVAGYEGLALLKGYEGELLQPALDFDVYQAGRDFPGYRLYLLVQRPEGMMSLDAIHARYPDIYRRGAPLCLHAGDWGAWRLYEIMPP